MSLQAETEEEGVNPSSTPVHEQHGSQTAVQSQELQRPDRSKLMVPEEINGSGLELGYRGRVRQISNSSTSSCESSSSVRSKEDRDNFKDRQSPDRSDLISSFEDEDEALDDTDLVGSYSPTIACE